MHNVTTSRHIRTATELCILVPIKHAFVPITELVMTYAARVSTVLKALAELRQHKVERGFGDPIGPIELLESIYRVQWTVLEPYDDVGSQSANVTRQLASPQILLTSHFDRSWEDYFYDLVGTGGPLLDLIFSHCEGYDNQSCRDGYDEFADFIRRHQRPCNFMYAGSPEVTIDDIRYFTHSVERPAQLETLSVPRVRVEAVQLAHNQQLHDERTRAAARGVHGLYDLGRRFFCNVPGLQTREGSRTDQALYEDAVRSILQYEPDFVRLRSVLHFARAKAVVVGVAPSHNELVDTALWIDRLIPNPPTLPDTTPLRSAYRDVAKQAAGEPLRLEDIQGNVLSGYGDVQRGCVLFFQCLNADGVRRLLDEVSSLVTTEAESRDAHSRGKARVNLGITYSGFKLLKLPASVLEQFPREFREGMEERAGMLGDIAHNHPATWRLPLRADGSERVHLSAIHAALTVLGDAANVERISEAFQSNEAWELVHVLALNPDGTRERSQPLPHAAYRAPAPAEPSPLDEVALGELFLGYENRDGRRAACADEARNPRSAVLFKNGTFMAMRKMQQDEAALSEYVALVVQQIVAAGGAQTPSLPDEIRALIIGRRPDGSMLGALQPTPGRDPNAFDFSSDASGALCPLHSHIRRANPRTDPALGKTPRIVRRGMAYDREPRGPEAGEQGLLFMAYCANLAEQYEIVQRWVNGGNSTGLASRHNDLLCGAPLEAKIPRVVSLAGTSARTADAASSTITLPERSKPFVTLRWGLYFFAPSLRSLRWLVEESKLLRDADASEHAVSRGRQRIAEIEALPPKLRSFEWKRILEEVPEAGSAQARLAEDVAAAITHAGGALFIAGDPAQREEAPDLVVVTTAEHARTVLRDDEMFSVQAYRTRMHEALQDHYLGYDVKTVDETTGRSYAQQSDVPNQMLAQLKPRAYQEAYACAQRILDEPGEIELDPDGQSPDGTRRSTINVRDLACAVISQLCHTWLDMPGIDGKTDLRSLMNALERFLVASRYCFQALPVDHLRQVARSEQRSIRSDYSLVNFASDVALSLTQATLAPAPAPQSQRRPRDPLRKLRGSRPPLSREVSVRDAKTTGKSSSNVKRVSQRPSAPPMTESDLTAFRRMAVIGAVGFAPPAVGAITRVLDQWIENEQLWQLQRLDRRDQEALLPAIYAALGQTPAPPTLYRTALPGAKVGALKVPADARVVVNLAAVYADAKQKGLAQPEAWFYGGVHGGATREHGNPPHGCPGREAGGLVMAGVIAALFDRKSLKRERRFHLSYEASRAHAGLSATAST